MSESGYQVPREWWSRVVEERDALAAELAEAKAQRDSWKRIAESGLGITAETQYCSRESNLHSCLCKGHPFNCFFHPSDKCGCSTAETSAECIHKWIGLASGGFRCTQCDAELEPETEVAK